VSPNALRSRVVELVQEVQRLPYVWPASPDAASARTAGSGTCASKHALLAEGLDAIGIQSHPLFVVGRLIPDRFAEDEDLRDGLSLLEVHECLTVTTPWAGPLRVDVTWDPALVRWGLPGTLDWDGASDMSLALDAIGPGWAVSRDGLRDAKESLRSRLYAPGQRDVRDRVLRDIAARFALVR